MGRKPLVKRCIGNRAISLYVKTQRFASDAILNSLFTCSTCFRVHPDGVCKWDGVAMNSTATGILDKLSRFQQPKIVSQVIKNISSHSLWVLVDAIFTSAKVN